MQSRPLWLLKSLAVVLLLTGATGAEAQQRWMELSSDHYRVAGDLAPDQLEQAAIRFEAFHSAVSELFSPRQYPRVPMATVLVLASDDDLDALDLNGGEAYFLADDGGHYVAMLSESSRSRPVEKALHDYFHAVAAVTIPNAPLWLEEGLAEFYSTVSWSTDGRNLEIGRPIDAWVRRVREDGSLLRFDDVLAAESGSHDDGGDSIFQAQTWAFVHYLVTRNEGSGYPETIRFVRLLSSEVVFEQAVADAFGVTFRTLLGDFERSVRERGTYPYLNLSVGDSSRGLGSSVPNAISAAEVETHFAELLIRRGAISEAETRLQEAIGAYPDAVAPRLALSRLLIDEARFVEARTTLQPVADAPMSDPLVSFYSALAFLRDRPSYDSAGLDEARNRLREVIRMNPDHGDAYYELALTYLGIEATNVQIEEAAELLETALQLQPLNPEYLFSMAGALIEQKRFEDARSVVVPLIDEVQAPNTRSRARSVLQSIEGLEGGGGVRGEGFTELTRGPENEDDDPVVPPQPAEAAPSIESERFELTRIVTGQQQEGVLSLIDCREGLTLTVDSDSGTYLFHTDSPDRVEFATFTSEVGTEVRCGPVDPPLSVVVTYQAAPAGSEFVGVPNKVEFVSSP